MEPSTNSSPAHSPSPTLTPSSYPRKTKIIPSEDKSTSMNSSTETTPSTDPIDNVELEGEEDDEEIKRLEEVVNVASCLTCYTRTFIRSPDGDKGMIIAFTRLVQ